MYAVQSGGLYYIADHSFLDRNIKSGDTTCLQYHVILFVFWPSTTKATAKSEREKKKRTPNCNLVIIPASSFELFPM